MPLVHENRLIVKKWLEITNKNRETLAPWLRMMLEHLNIKRMDTYHIGFMIGPRLNATGRMWSAVEWLKSLLFKEEKKILDQFAKMEQLNTDRKKLQDKMMVRIIMK
jgi:single-stranded-DNA-specific exonuclease